MDRHEKSRCAARLPPEQGTTARAPERQAQARPVRMATRPGPKSWPLAAPQHRQIMVQALLAGLGSACRQAGPADAESLVEAWRLADAKAVARPARLPCRRPSGQSGATRDRPGSNRRLLPITQPQTCERGPRAWMPCCGVPSRASGVHTAEGQEPRAPVPRQQPQEPRARPQVLASLSPGCGTACCLPHSHRGSYSCTAPCASVGPALVCSSEP